MARNQMGQKQYSNVMVCGASAMSFGHQDGEPTVFDNIASAFRRLTSGENARSVSSNRSAAAAQGIAG